MGDFLWRHDLRPFSASLLQGRAVARRGGPLRVATVVFLADGCAFYFFGNFAKAVALALRTACTDLDVNTNRFVSFVCCRGTDFPVPFRYARLQRLARMVFDWLYCFFDCGNADSLFYSILSTEKPAHMPGPAGTSLVLDALFGHGHGLGSAVKSFEDLLGVKLSEMWIVRYLRQTSRSSLSERSSSAGFPPASLLSQLGAARCECSLDVINRSRCNRVCTSPGRGLSSSSKSSRRRWFAKFRWASTKT